MRRSARSELAMSLALPLALAAAVTIVMVGMASAKSTAKSPSLKVAKNAVVSEAGGATVRENIVVSAKGLAVYTLSGDSQQDPKCTKANGCFSAWHPVTTTARKPAVGSGVSGKVAVWHRDGFEQLTLNGHPLYTFIGDKHADSASGDGLMSFGGTWHVVKVAGAVHVVSTTTTTTTPTTSTYTYPTTQTTTTTTTTTPMTSTSTTGTYTYPSDPTSPTTTATTTTTTTATTTTPYYPPY